MLYFLKYLKDLEHKPLSWLTLNEINVSPLEVGKSENRIDWTYKRVL